MSLFLTDAEIAALLAKPKPLPSDWRARLTVKAKRGPKERELEIRGGNGSTFRLILRQADLNPLDFSVILAFLVPNTSQVFRLRRHNGKSQEHTNHLEGQTFYDSYIHQATERYQRDGRNEESFAEVTDRYADFRGALDAMISDGSFVQPPSPDMPLLEGLE